MPLDCPFADVQLPCYRSVAVAPAEQVKDNPFTWRKRARRQESRRHGRWDYGLQTDRDLALLLAGRLECAAAGAGVDSRAATVLLIGVLSAAVSRDDVPYHGKPLGLDRCLAGSPLPSQSGPAGPAWGLRAQISGPGTLLPDRAIHR